MDIFIKECKCGNFKFVFAEKPHKAVEVICPKCGGKTKINPKEKESDK
jgi:rRNA maturation endonuclease Nob1